MTSPASILLARVYETTLSQAQRIWGRYMGIPLLLWLGCLNAPRWGPKMRLAPIWRCLQYLSFEKYIKNCLPSFSIEEAGKFDLHANKNSKYLLYKFNDWIESLGGKKLLIRHTSKAQDIYRLENIEEKEETVPDRKNYTWNRKRKSLYYLYRK